jgi:tetratricopeptide (TPR) repeat protein
LSWNYLQKQMWTEATQAGARAVELSGRDPLRLSSLAQCLAASGRRAEAEAVLAELGAMSPRRYVSPLEIAYIHLALGQTDLAFQWLDKAVAERASFLVLLRVEPRADPLRSDLRFADLLRRVGLPSGRPN